MYVMLKEYIFTLYIKFYIWKNLVYVFILKQLDS